MMQTATINDVDACDEIDTETENETDDPGKEEQKSKFIHLRAKGHSYARIAKELAVSKGTLINWNTELETEIGEARSVELDSAPSKAVVSQLDNPAWSKGSRRARSFCPR